MAIPGLEKGEPIIKDLIAFALGKGYKYKKINITHLIGLLYRWFAIKNLPWARCS